ncbi:hypothetical protein DL764_009241 [Monosporascus ibericus]|uniref:Uncharacterized protein n=1 Tax=Monosporascus ibericus TaxID=155417 RepID=A0A4Q4SXR2_9PEZI|nr:hypothetical protein DL764_009241 [Monosporascus ibericus]
MKKVHSVEWDLADLAFTYASMLKCPEGYECSLPFIPKDAVTHDQILLMPAILASHADLLRVLLKHDFLHPNCDPFIRFLYWKGDKLSADSGMPRWPLYFSVHLMSEPEAIECLIAAGAKLSRLTPPHGVEPKILASLRGCRCVEEARQRFLDAHLYLRGAYRYLIDHMRGSAEIVAAEQLLVGAELLGLEVKPRSAGYHVTSGVDSIPSLPRVLETEESFLSWRERVIEILEKAANNRNQQTAARHET